MAVSCDFLVTTKLSDTSSPYYIYAGTSSPGDYDFWACMGGTRQDTADLVGNYGWGTGVGNTTDGGPGYYVANAKNGDNDYSATYIWRTGYNYSGSGYHYLWAEVDAGLQFGASMFGLNGCATVSPCGTPTTRTGYGTGTGDYTITVGRPDSVIMAIAHNFLINFGYGISWTGITEVTEYYPNNDSTKGVISVATKDNVDSNATVNASWGSNNANYSSCGVAWLPPGGAGNRVVIMMMKLPSYIEQLVSRVRSGCRLRRCDGWYHPEPGVFIPDGPLSAVEPLRYTARGMKRKLWPGFCLMKNGLAVPA